MGSAVAEFGVPSAGIGTYRSLGPQILHIFAVSPIHLHQLRAGRRATLHVVAFRRQELLFDLTLSLTGSHTFHTVSHSLQSVSINFELDVGLHFVSLVFRQQEFYSISPHRSPTRTVFPLLFARFCGLSNPSQSTLIGLHLLSWLLVFGSCLISPYHSTSLPVSHRFSRVLSIANYTAVESSPYIPPCRASYLSYISPSVFTVYISAKPSSIVRFHSTQYSTKNGLRHQQSSA